MPGRSYLGETPGGGETSEEKRETNEENKKNKKGF